jgi:protein-disulfide isomerase
VALAAACGPEAPPRLGGSSVVGPTRAAPLLGPTDPPAQGAQTAANNPRALGDPNAPIVVVEYSDYQ